MALYIMFMLPGILLMFWAQNKVKGSYVRYSKMPNSKGITGAQAARMVLDANGLQNVQIEGTKGELTDHYDPRSRVLRLSQGIYTMPSVAAVAVAAHEAGHAILAYVLPHCPTVERVTIASEEEDYLGYVLHAVSLNQHVRTRAELRDSICVALGGRQAELMVLDEVSSGCLNDLQQATAVASLMVEQLGMSQSMGLRTYRHDRDNSQLVIKPRDVSETTATQLDQEIRQVVGREPEQPVPPRADGRGVDGVVRRVGVDEAAEHAHGPGRAEERERGVHVQPVERVGEGGFGAVHVGR